MRTAHLILLTGIAAPLLYVATVIIGAWATPGYSHLSQPVSALFETGAPHAFAVSLAFVAYNTLLATFGIGLLRGSGLFRRLAAAMILLNGAFGLAIEFAPMDPAGNPVTVAGGVHMMLAGLLVLTCMAAMASMAIAWWSDRSNRILAAITVGLLGVMLVAGALAAGSATAGWPLLGLLQRLTIGSYLVWLPMLAWAVASHRV